MECLIFNFETIKQNILSKLLKTNEMTCKSKRAMNMKKYLQGI